MAMTKQLWSLNGLATELGYDRRTVALALHDVRPDGKLKGHNAWYLDTALSCLKRTAKRRRPEMPVAKTDPFADSILSRLHDWREIYVERSANDRALGDAGLDDVASTFKVEPSTVLTWLRAGCPYVREGDWETGAGFKLRHIWTVEWSTLVFGHLVSTNNREALSELGMGGWMNRTA